MRHWKRKTDRGVSREVLCVAARDVDSGRSIRGVAKSYGICYVTLNRFVKKTRELQKAGSHKLPAVGYSRHKLVFTTEQEKVFRDCLKKACDVYWLSHKEVRKLAFLCAVRFNCRYPETWNTSAMAGKDWMTSFVKRNPTLPIRNSAARASKHKDKHNHDQWLSRTFDEVMKLGDFSGCSSGSIDQVAGRGEDSEGSGREERNGRTSFLDTLSVAGQGGNKLDGLPVFGAYKEEEDWHVSLPMDTLAELDIDRTNNRPDESTDRQKYVRDNLLTDGQADEERASLQGESRGSAHPTHTSSPDSLDEAVLNHSEGGGVSTSHQRKRSEWNPGPPIPPLMNIIIKDEPIDEGYDCALLPQSSSIKQIKDELEHQEDVLTISSVHSVGGGNSYVSHTASQTPSILGAGRSLAPAPPRCGTCSKVLLKGQTAYRRKGSTQLFCSTVCLTGFPPNTVLGKTCHQLAVGSSYKQICSSMVDCAHCKNKAVVSSMLVSNDLQGKVKLYCSSTCVSYSRPPQHVLTVEKCKRRYTGLREPAFEDGPTSENMPQSPAPHYTAQSQGSEVVLDLVPVEVVEDQKLLGISSPSTPAPPTSSAISTTMVKRGPERKHVDQPVNGAQTAAFEEKLLGILREQNNEDELWCLSLAPKLKHLSHEQKSRFQMRVAQLLHEVRFS